jgi:hypothetical protein
VILPRLVSFDSRISVGLGFGLSLLVGLVVLCSVSRLLGNPCYEGCWETPILKVVRQPLVSAKIVRQSSF